MRIGARGVARTAHRNFSGGYVVLVLSAPLVRHAHPRATSFPVPDADKGALRIPMRRPFRTLLLVSALTAVVALPASASAVTVGVSDQQASTFTNPLFKPLKMKVARYVAPYDVATTGGTQQAAWESWLHAARAAHQTVLVSFEHSRDSHYNRAPSVSASTPKRRASRSRGRGRAIWARIRAWHASTTTISNSTPS